MMPLSHTFFTYFIVLYPFLSFVCCLHVFPIGLLYNLLPHFYKTQYFTFTTKYCVTEIEKLEIDNSIYQSILQGNWYEKVSIQNRKKYINNVQGRFIDLHKKCGWFVFFFRISRIFHIISVAGYYSVFTHLPITQLCFLLSLS